MKSTDGATVFKPQPRVNGVTSPFWEGANAGKLMIQRCSKCGSAIFYPRVCCPFCKEADLAWEEASGRGQIISHTTVRRTHHDGFNTDAPYVFAAVALEEGPCIYGQVPNAPLESSLVGREVRVDFVEHGPGRKMPIFRVSP